MWQLSYVPLLYKCRVEGFWEKLNNIKGKLNHKLCILITGNLENNVSFDKTKVKKMSGRNISAA